MQTVILAGGLGTRIRSVAPHVPKILIPVAGRIFIEHQFDLLRAAGLTEVLLCVGHLGRQVEDHVGDGSHFGMSVRYSYDPPKGLLGTGGALVHALSLLQDSFLIMYGDSYLPTDFAKIVAWFGAHSYPSLMTVVKNNNQWDKSNAEVLGELVSLYSKSALSHEVSYVDYGISIFKRSVIEEYKKHPLPLDLSLVQEALANRGKLGAFEIKERFYEIGKPEGLQDLEAYLQKSSAQID